jgi:hypothetical protein
MQTTLPSRGLWCVRIEPCKLCAAWGSSCGTCAAALRPWGDGGFGEIRQHGGCAARTNFHAHQACAP